MMITDEQVRKLYEMAGWTAQYFAAPGGGELWYIANLKGREADTFSDHYMSSPEAAWRDAKLPDPRRSLDAAFRLLDAIAPHKTVEFSYFAGGLACYIGHPMDKVSGFDLYDVYTPGKQLSRALALTAALLAYVREREAQS